MENLKQIALITLHKKCLVLYLQFIEMDRLILEGEPVKYEKFCYNFLNLFSVEELVPS